jgi:hypothetical protein
MNFQLGNKQRRNNMKAEYLNNWHYLSTTLRDAARDVVAGTITIKDASAKHDLPIEWIEAKATDPLFEPPKPALKNANLVGLSNQPVPRSVLTVEEKRLKDGFIDPLQKRRLHSHLVTSLGQAATEVHTKQLTIEAAAEKYDVAVSDIQKRLKDPMYQPEQPLPPNFRVDPRRANKKDNHRRGGSMELVG